MLQCLKKRRARYYPKRHQQYSAKQVQLHKDGTRTHIFFMWGARAMATMTPLLPNRAARLRVHHAKQPTRSLNLGFRSGMTSSMLGGVGFVVLRWPDCHLDLCDCQETHIRPGNGFLSPCFMGFEMEPSFPWLNCCFFFCVSSICVETILRRIRNLLNCIILYKVIVSIYLDR